MTPFNIGSFLAHLVHAVGFWGRKPLILTETFTGGCSKVSVKESFSTSKNEIPNLWTHQPRNLCIDNLSTDRRILFGFMEEYAETKRLS